jgi:subtilisin family serine protease
MLSYPANLPETIGVGSITNEDMRTPCSQYRNGIDFVAPSSGRTLCIEPTDVCGAFGHHPQPDGDDCKAVDASGFGRASSATLLAAGVAALMLSVNNYLTAEQVRAILRDTCEKIDQANANYNGRGWSAQYGYGRINAAAAVKRAQELIKPRARGSV